MEFSKSLSALFLAILFLSSLSGASAQVIYPEVDPYADPQTIKQIVGGIIDLYKEFGGPDGDLPTTFFVGDRIYKIKITGRAAIVKCLTYDKVLYGKHSVGDMFIMKNEGILPKAMIEENFFFDLVDGKIMGYDKFTMVNYLGTDIVSVDEEGIYIQTHIWRNRIYGTAIAKERNVTAEELRKMIGAFRYHLTEIDTALRWKIIEKGPRP